jgi:hypothetical protein
MNIMPEAAHSVKGQVNQWSAGAPAGALAREYAGEGAGAPQKRGGYNPTLR